MNARLRALAQGYQQAVKAGIVSDCTALSDFASDLASQSTSASQFVKGFGILTPPQLANLVPGIASNATNIFLNTGQASGYLTAFQNTLPDNPTTNGDQGHDFAAFFQFGYRYYLAGITPGSIASFGLEYFEGLQSGIMNLGDVALGDAAAQIGADLASGKISMSDVPGRIEALCSK